MKRKIENGEEGRRRKKSRETIKREGRGYRNKRRNPLSLFLAGGRSGLRKEDKRWKIKHRKKISDREDRKN